MTDNRIKTIADANGFKIICNKTFEELGELNTALAVFNSPKEPIDCKCPCCGESVFLETRAGWYQVEHHLKVCENCGQKIDWSSDKN